MTWEQMAKKPEPYLPLIERLVGCWLMMDVRSNPDVDPCNEEALRLIPEIKALSVEEQDFVKTGALEVYYQDDPGYEIRSMARSWIADGAAS